MSKVIPSDEVKNQCVSYMNDQKNKIINGMKKYLLSALSLIFPLLASAYDVEIDGICYNLNQNEKEAEVSHLHYNLGEIMWSVDYRFAPESNPTGEECYLVPMDVWERLKTETFYVTVKGENPQIYLTDGWWSSMYTSDFIMPGNELLTDNGDGTWTLAVNFVGDLILDNLDDRHLLFTGSGYSVGDIYLKGTVMGDGSEEITFVWKNGTYQSDAANIPEKIIYEEVEYTVTAIGERGLCGYNGLTSVTIPNSVNYIAKSIFESCRNLASVKVDSGNTKYDSREDCNAIIETNSNTLIAGCKNTVIPNTVTSIGDFAFSHCSEMYNLTIPNSVTKIGEYAFGGCSSLISMEIPNSVASIGDWAFCACSGLTSVTIPNSVTYIGEWAFADCMSLTSVIIPHSVTSIGDYTFYMCWGLTSVVIPNTVASIGAFAFAYCPLKDFYCYPEQVPDTSDGSLFESSSIEQATLHVPASSINDYRSTSPWNGFMNIVALKEGDPSGIKQIVNGVMPTDDKPVYNLNGQRVNPSAKGIFIKNGHKYIVK